MPQQYYDLIYLVCLDGLAGLAGQTCLAGQAGPELGTSQPQPFNY